MKFIGMAFSLFCINLFAGLSFPTSTRLVPFGIESGLMGSIQVIVNSDDFSLATPDAPIYQRLAWTAGTLSHSLVDEGDEPIYLPLYYWDGEGDLVAPADTVAIVRWVAGEEHVWIRIQHSSSSWLQDGDAFVSPSTDRKVSYRLGHSASWLAEDLDQYAENKKNLPFTTRDPRATRQQADLAVSTLLCFNLDGVSESFIDLGVQHFDGIENGNMLDIQSFAGGSLADLGVRNCNAEISGDAVSVEGQNVTGQFTFQAQCEATFNYMSMFDGSYLDLHVSDNANYGFHESSFRFENENDGTFEVDLDSAFTLNDQTLYRRGRLHYSGEAINLTEASALIVANIALGDATEIIIEYDMVIQDLPAPQDETPFDGEEQHRLCGITTYNLGSGQWRIATTESTYLIPHLTTANGGFNTSLIFNNSSDQEQSITAQAYTEAGETSTTTGVTLLAGETKTVSAQVLFEDENAAHCRLITDDAVKTVIQYQLNAENSGPAHGLIDNKTSKIWTFFGGNQSRTWDGFAVVNQGAFNTDIRCTQYAADGSVITTVTLARDVAPNQKILALINDYFDGVDGAKYVIEAERELSLITLRGDHSSLFLWQNAAIPQ